MTNLLDSYDQSIMLFLNYDGGVWLDNFWYTFSGKFIWAGMHLSILLFMYYTCRSGKLNIKAFLWFVICTAMVVALADQISSGIIKHLVERPRPSHNPAIEDLLHYVNDYKGGRFGFVSSHAANSIGFAVWLRSFFRAPLFRCTIFLWSIFNCYSRIYLGVHYLGDILGGLLVGIICAWFVHFIYRRYLPESAQIPLKNKEPWPITSAIFATVLFIAVYSCFDLL